MKMKSTNDHTPAQLAMAENDAESGRTFESILDASSARNNLSTGSNHVGHSNNVSTGLVL